MTGSPLTSGDISLKLLNVCLTILSSNEWNVITHMRPPLFKRFTASFRLDSRMLSSSFTSILIA